MRFIKLNNETEMPIIGLGTWKSEPSEAYAAVRWALKLGYTHFDCAAIYNNEEAVGQAFADAMAEDGLKREDIFVTSKLWNNAHRAEDVAPALQETLTRLKLEYLDLYLMHTWQAMEELYKEGKAKAIGVSNFGEKSLTELAMTSEINPMVNQVESHPYLPQEELLAYCQKNMIALTAYSPLGSGSSVMLEDPVIDRIAEKNNATPAQILLAWNMQRGVAVIPKAVEEKHLRENLAALNVELDAGDMAAIASIGKNERFLTADVFEIGPYQGMDIFA